MPLNLKHQSTSQFVTRLREAYRNADPERVISLANFIILKVQSGDLTEAELRTAFGKSTSQWTAFKNRMNALINARNTVRSAVGE